MLQSELGPFLKVVHRIKFGLGSKRCASFGEPVQVNSLGCYSSCHRVILYRNIEQINIEMKLYLDLNEFIFCRTVLIPVYFIFGKKLHSYIHRVIMSPCPSLCGLIILLLLICNSKGLR